MTLAKLLATPDPLDLIGVWGHRRGHRITCNGKVHQRDKIKLALAIAYATWQWQEHSDISQVLWTAMDSELRAAEMPRLLQRRR